MGAPVVGIHFHPTGRAFVTTTLDGRSRVLVSEDGSSFRQAAKLRGGGSTAVRCEARFSPGGGLIAGGSDAGELVLWHTAPRACDPALSALQGGSAGSAAAAPIRTETKHRPCAVVALGGGSAARGSAALSGVDWCPDVVPSSRPGADDGALVACCDARGLVAIVSVPWSGV